MSTPAVDASKGRDDLAAEMGGLILLWGVPVAGFCLAMLGVR